MDYTVARRHMVESQVRTNDVTDQRIQSSFLRVPRELFLPPGQRQFAYAEKEQRLDAGGPRSMVTARDLAKLLAAIDPRPHELALDVGFGSGYSSAILAGLCEMVVCVEDSTTLAAAAQDLWTSLEIDNTAAVVGPLSSGAPRQGPFDIILVGAAVEKMPEALLDQLKDKGRLGCFMIEDGLSRGVVFVKSGEAVSRRRVFDASARLVLPEFAAEPKFTF